MLAIAACSSPEVEGKSEIEYPRFLTESEMEAGIAAQQEALESGGVSKADYEAFFKSWVECMQTNDIPVVSAGWDPITNTALEHWIDMDSVYIDTLEESDQWFDAYSYIERECREAYLDDIELEYALLNPEFMNNDIALEVDQCLSDAGVKTPEALPENISEFKIEAPRNKAHFVDECAKEIRLSHFDTVMNSHDSDG
ncbi:hypothetical protein [Natronoglycomyces albus]|uniref:Uncharacterized protein n=1 Tax=Natronoglycomyces albus TaxID=2811108 RepID=A0A895XLP3_9ACTN|nr:hypothetical protein [Natronoglycomyces albus]QSB04339.1 hypothetical protein JQS30_11090 [Natronoglycomyces albus]